MEIDRRKFLKIAGLGTAVAVLAGCERIITTSIVKPMTTPFPRGGEQFGPTPSPMGESLIVTPAPAAVPTPGVQTTQIQKTDSFPKTSTNLVLFDLSVVLT